MKNIKSYESFNEKVKIPNELIDKLITLPEKGMGYQIVDVELKNGTIINDVKIVNSSYLLISGLQTSDIKDVIIK